MDKFFKEDILTVFVPVRGETSHYAVGISFGNVLTNIQEQIKRNNEELSVKIITRALIKSFNDNDVRIRCDCADFIYRQSYWLSKEDIILGDKETRPSDITNPGNTKGRGCKHILLVLNNNSWLIKVSSCIFNYVNYMKDHYERLYRDIIYPAIYGEPYTDDDDDGTQMDMFGDNLPDDDIDTANKYAKTKTQFKKGNEYRFQPIEQEDEKQISFEMD